MSTAAVYARVSTSQQAAKDKISIDDQIKHCLARAQQDGYEVPLALIYKDEGVSGALDRDERRAFGELLADASKNRFDRVYFLALDRLGRDQAIIATALRDFKRWDIDYVSIREPELGQPLYRALVAGMAEAEHLRIRERTWPAKRRKFLDGFFVLGEPPFGYRLASNLTLLQCPAEADLVRTIFEESLAGRGRTQIARRLNSVGAAPPKVRVRMADGTVKRVRPGYHDGWGGFRAWVQAADAEIIGATEWQSTSIQKVVSNTLAFGELNGVAMRIEPCPIISRAEFMRARQAAQERTQKGKAASHNHLLTGLLRCASCGAHYRHHVGRLGARRWCCNGRRSGKACRSPNLRHDDVIRGLLDFLGEYLIERFDEGHFVDHLLNQVKTKVDETRKALETAQAALPEAEARKIALNQDVQFARRHGLTDGEISAIVTELRMISSERDKLERRVRDLTYDLGRARTDFAQTEHEALLAAHIARYKLELTLEEWPEVSDLRRMIETIVEVIVVHPDGGCGVRPRPENVALPEVIRILAKEAVQNARAGANQ
jgi:site-specific DNA recombinase